MQWVEDGFESEIEDEMMDLPWESGFNKYEVTVTLMNFGASLFLFRYMDTESEMETDEFSEELWWFNSRYFNGNCWVNIYIKYYEIFFMKMKNKWKFYATIVWSN